MGSSAPAFLPVSTTQSTDSQPPVNVSAFHAFLTHLNENLRNSLSQSRPWNELADRSSFSKPKSYSDATIRIRKNYAYFRINYLLVIGLIFAFSLLSHPFSLLLLLGLSFSWIFLYLFRPADRPLVLFGRTFSDRETLGMLVLFSVFVIFLTSVGSILISAVLVGFGLVCAHDAFRKSEDLFLDEQEPTAIGILSFLGGAASNVAAATILDVASRI